MMFRELNYHFMKTQLSFAYQQWLVQSAIFQNLDISCFYYKKKKKN